MPSSISTTLVIDQLWTELLCFVLDSWEIPSPEDPLWLWHANLVLLPGLGYSSQVLILNCWISSQLRFHSLLVLTTKLELQPKHMASMNSLDQHFSVFYDFNIYHTWPSKTNALTWFFSGLSYLNKYRWSPNWSDDSSKLIHNCFLLSIFHFFFRLKIIWKSWNRKTYPIFCSFF